MNTLPTIHERLRERRDRLGSSPKLSEDQAARIRDFFAAHPTVGDVYLCYDGAILEGVAFRGTMTSRTAQLLSLQTIGIPANISRGHSQIRAEGGGA